MFRDLLVWFLDKVGHRSEFDCRGELSFEMLLGQFRLSTLSAKHHFQNMMIRSSPDFHVLVLEGARKAGYQIF